MDITFMCACVYVCVCVSAYVHGVYVNLALFILQQL